MASEPQANQILSGSIPENLADDVPHDVDFNALMARSQSQLLMQTAREVQANQDLREKLEIIKAYKGL